MAQDRNVYDRRLWPLIPWNALPFCAWNVTLRGKMLNHSPLRFPEPAGHGSPTETFALFR